MVEPNNENIKTQRSQQPPCLTKERFRKIKQLPRILDNEGERARFEHLHRRRGSVELQQSRNRRLRHYRKRSQDFHVTLDTERLRNVVEVQIGDCTATHKQSSGDEA